MTLDDLKQMENTLYSDFDNFWSYNVLKQELENVLYLQFGVSLIMPYQKCTGPNDEFFVHEINPLLSEFLCSQAVLRESARAQFV